MAPKAKSCVISGVRKKPAGNLQSPKSIGSSRILKSDILKKRAQLSRDIIAASKHKSIPNWVEGPRPSDECIAMHRKADPSSKKPCKPPSKATALEERMPSACDHLYELPAAFAAKTVNADGVKCTWANWPGTGAENGVILYFHGGAFLSGHINVNRCARLSCMTGMRVLAVDYRLAPEHPMPTSTEDCVQAYVWLIKTTRPEQVVLYGPSSGATLVMLVLQALTRRNLPLPGCGVPVSIWIPHMTGFKIWQKAVGNEDWFGRISGTRKKSWEEIMSDPHMNPMAGELRGLPPLYVGIGSLENIDRDLKASRQLAEAAKAAGVIVELDVARNLQHCPGNNLFLVPEDTAFIARAAAFMHKCLSSARM